MAKTAVMKTFSLRVSKSLHWIVIALPLCIVISLLQSIRTPTVSNADTLSGRSEDALSGGPPARKTRSIAGSLPIIYVITATYKRPEQIAELTRLGQTLRNVPAIHWIVGDDGTFTNQQVMDLLEFLGIPYTYLLTPMPSKFKKGLDKRKPWDVKSAEIKYLPKGVANRMAGLDWVRGHATSGVVYFADDDNTYDVRVFEEMRYTQRVSMWPVGLIAITGVSTPVIKDGKFVGWYDGWVADRKFPVDMAGFAVSVQYLLKTPNATMPYQAGYEETGFLESLNISPGDIEFKADNCSKIYVWHTQTVETFASARRNYRADYQRTNLEALKKYLVVR